MKQKRYTDEQKLWAVQEMLPPRNRTVVQVSRETGITTVSLRAWRNAALGRGGEMAGRGKAERWSSADKFQAVLESAPLSEAESSEYCRRKAIQPEQLQQWRTACERANDSQASQDAAAESNPTAQALIKELQRELRRKDAALAETAALLVLRKKADAIWGKDGDE